VSDLTEAFRAVVREELDRTLAELRAVVVQANAAPDWVAIKACGLPEATARRLVKARVIAGSRVGRDIYVLRADVDRYFESQRIGADDEGDEVSRAIARRNLRLVTRGGR
jgi:hypothetical protein